MFAINVAYNGNGNGNWEWDINNYREGPKRRRAELQDDVENSQHRSKVNKYGAVKVLWIAAGI